MGDGEYFGSPCILASCCLSSVRRNSILQVLRLADMLLSVVKASNA